jgi:hypothetical protein
MPAEGITGEELMLVLFLTVPKLFIKFIEALSIRIVEIYQPRMLEVLVI